MRLYKEIKKGINKTTNGYFQSESSRRLASLSTCSVDLQTNKIKLRYGPASRAMIHQTAKGGHFIGLGSRCHGADEGCTWGFNFVDSTTGLTTAMESAMGGHGGTMCIGLS